MNINISGVGGDVVGVGVTGSGNIVGKNITVHGGIRLDPQLLARLPGEYAASLQDFSTAVNAQFQASQVPAEKVEPLQKEVEALAKEVETIKPEEPVPFMLGVAIQRSHLNGFHGVGTDNCAYFITRIG